MEISHKINVTKCTEDLTRCKLGSRRSRSAWPVCVYEKERIMNIYKEKKAQTTN